MQPFILQLYHLSTLSSERFGIPAQRGRSSDVPCNATLCASTKDEFLSNDTLNKFQWDTHGPSLAWPSLTKVS